MNTWTKLAVGTALGAAGAFLLPGRDDDTPATPMELPDGARAAVVTGSSMPAWAVVALGAVTGALAARRNPLAGIVGLTTIGLRETTVTVSNGGVRIDSGLPGVGYTFDIGQIRSARAVTVTASEFGGLGLRWSVTRGWGLILRTGEALVLELENGKFTVTTDDATSAASLINAVANIGDHAGA